MRAFNKGADFTKALNVIINDIVLTEYYGFGSHFYFQVRLFFLSNIFFIFVGAMCMSMRGHVPPIMICLIFTQLEGVNNGLAAIMHGGREIVANFAGI